MSDEPTSNELAERLAETLDVTLDVAKKAVASPDMGPEYVKKLLDNHESHKYWLTELARHRQNLRGAL